MRILIAGVLVGALVSAAFLALWQPVRLEYVPSLSRVDAGGRNEIFEINLATDRLFRAGAGIAPDAALPAGRTIDPPTLAAVRAEVFELRDARDQVIGLASRLRGTATSDWVLYVPARGALFLTDTGVTTTADGSQVGTGRIVGGTQTFAAEKGTYTLARTADGRLSFATAMQAVTP